MKYKFTVDYIHNSFIEAHPTMHENHPDFIKATSTSIYELDHAEEVSLEVAQQNVVQSLESDNCKVLRISGARIG